MDDTDKYVTELLDYRRRKDEHFRTPNSPLAPEERSAFSGLAYYPPNPAYRVTAALEFASEDVTVNLPTTTGDTRLMRLLGTARASTPAGEVRLTVFVPLDDATRGFIPFRDATSGAETYGAARYVDATVHGDTVLIDFNLAYHPYCAYSDRWSCPLPPRENWLELPIRSGERLPI